jgi:hypothetical protein
MVAKHSKSAMSRCLVLANADFIPGSLAALELALFLQGEVSQKGEWIGNCFTAKLCEVARD